MSRVTKFESKGFGVVTMILTLTTEDLRAIQGETLDLKTLHGRVSKEILDAAHDAACGDVYPEHPRTCDGCGVVFDEDEDNEHSGGLCNLCHAIEKD